jgi:L-alanine-DL-glutamate epimerase-like enolase superfamily enzyme
VKIGAVRVIVTSPERNYVTVKVETDEGICGRGDATLAGGELAVAAYLSEHVAAPIGRWDNLELVSQKGVRDRRW